MSFDISKVSDSDLALLIAALGEELKNRRLSGRDPETMATAAYDALFAYSVRVPEAPLIMENSVVALPGYLQRYTMNDDHKCSLYTVHMPGEDNGIWAWEDVNSSFLHSTSVRMDKTTQSVCLQLIRPGMVVDRQDMKYEDGKHIRKSHKAWRVIDNGGQFELRRDMSWKPGRLPSPQGENSL